MRAGIGLGSNLGDRLGNLAGAAKALHALSLDPASDKISSVYETAAVNCDAGAPNFLNAAMEIEYSGDPLNLLAKLQTLEELAGRPNRHPKNSPRTLDLDLLYLDDLTLDDERLVLPHPLIHTRQFVLTPLSEISPARILPNHRISIHELSQAEKFNVSDIKQLPNNLI